MDVIVGKPGKMKKGALLNISPRRAPPLALFIVAMALISLSMPLSLNAGSSIITIEADADNSSTIQMNIDKTSINFPSANPGSVPKIASSQNPVTITASAQIDDLSTATLTVTATADLASGTDKIPIGNVTWTVTGDGFFDGAMSNGTSFKVGSWQGPNQHVGVFAFSLVNSWSYATGNYSATVTYTLTAP